MIPTDPSSTLAASDFKNFRTAVTYPVKEIRDEVLEHYHKRLKKLKNKDGTDKYGNDTGKMDNELITFTGYRDSELGGNDRLGNTLESTNPQIVEHGDYTSDGMPPTLQHVHDNETRGPKVKVTNEGTVTHTDDKKNEIPEAHEYMHEIFDYILYEARSKLETINVKLEEFSKDPTPVKQAAYDNAVKNYDDFRASFPVLGYTPANPSPFASAFNEVKFKPVVTNEGFTVSLRVQLNWKNPRHSSSTIKVP